MPRILTVDDSATVRKLIRVHLRGMDLTIDEAENGAEGLKAMAKKQYDLLIVDLMMPVMDGIVMLRMKDSLKNTTPVILLTAEVSDTLAQAMANPCVMDYLKKPLQPGPLRVAVEQALSLAADEASSSG
jgi:two-component system, sensor histidine kinase SagS